jgi:integrase
LIGSGWTACRRASKLEESGGRIVALTDKQCDDLMRAAIASADPDCWLFVAFGLNTAMRHSEILSARFDRLDTANLRLFIPRAKAGERGQPITAELATLLERERETREHRNGWIFPALRRSKTGHRRRMARPFRDAVKRAGLDPAVVTPHVMRHTAITKLVQSGVDLPTVQRISGHKTLVMVLRYTHVHGPHINQAIRAIGRGLPEPAQNKPDDAATQELHAPRRARLKLVSGDASKA